MGSFQAGVGRVDITPPLSAPHASWGAQVHVFAEDVDLPLTCTALVVDDGTTRAAWIDFDLIILSTPETQKVQRRVSEETGIPPELVRVSVTHNHAGPPPSSWDWAKAGVDAMKAYYALLPDYAAGAARLAVEKLQPARVGVGRTESFVAVNRRETAPDGRTVTGTNPEGPIDPEVFVMRIDALDGSPIVAAIGYTMHPTTLGPSNKRLVGRLAGVSQANGRASDRRAGDVRARSDRGYRSGTGRVHRRYRGDQATGQQRGRGGDHRVQRHSAAGAEIQAREGVGIGLFPR